MTDSETTFSVEVLGFPGGSDPDALAESVSKFFGISLDEGRRLVKRAPIRVKRNAPPAVTQQLVRQLRKLGADVLVRNEQTGAEKTYHPREPSAPDSGLVEVPYERAPVTEAPATPQVVPAEPTLDTADDEAPPERAPQVEVVDLGAPPAEPAPAEPVSDRRPRDSGRRESLPGVRRRDSAPSIDRESVEPAAISAPAAPSPLISLPPPSMPGSASPSMPGSASPSQSKLDFCGSCKAPIEKGDTCARCGWNNAEKWRHCRQCKKKLSIVSAVSRRQASLGLVALGAFAIGGAVGALFGPFAGAAALAASAAAAFVLDALTLRFACKTCTVTVLTERFLKEETARIRSARTRSFAVVVVCAVAAGGLFFGGGGSARALSDASYGIAWTLKVPGSHSRTGAQVAQIAVPTGARKLRVQFAEKPYLGGTTYYLAHLQYTYPSGSTELDKAGLNAAAKQMIEVVFAGQPGTLEPAGESLDATFTGTFHGKQVAGRLRATQYEHDMILVAVTAAKPEELKDASVDQLLSSVAVQRDAK
jgi:hypothetical protein